MMSASHGGARRARKTGRHRLDLDLFRGNFQWMRHFVPMLLCVSCVQHANLSDSQDKSRRKKGASYCAQQLRQLTQLGGCALKDGSRIAWFRDSAALVQCLADEHVQLLPIPSGQVTHLCEDATPQAELGIDDAIAQMQGQRLAVHRAPAGALREDASSCPMPITPGCLRATEMTVRCPERWTARRRALGGFKAMALGGFVNAEVPPIRLARIGGVHAQNAHAACTYAHKSRTSFPKALEALTLEHVVDLSWSGRYDQPDQIFKRIGRRSALRTLEVAAGDTGNVTLLTPKDNVELSGFVQRGNYDKSGRRIGVCAGTRLYRVHFVCGAFKFTMSRDGVP